MIVKFKHTSNYVDGDDTFAKEKKMVSNEIDLKWLQFAPQHTNNC